MPAELTEQVAAGSARIAVSAARASAKRPARGIAALARGRPLHRHGPGARTPAPGPPTLGHLVCQEDPRPVRGTRRRAWVSAATLVSDRGARHTPRLPALLDYAAILFLHPLDTSSGGCGGPVVVCVAAFGVWIPLALSMPERTDCGKARSALERGIRPTHPRGGGLVSHFRRAHGPLISVRPDPMPSPSR